METLLLIFGFFPTIQTFVASIKHPCSKLRRWRRKPKVATTTPGRRRIFPIIITMLISIWYCMCLLVFTGAFVVKAYELIDRPRQREIERRAQSNAVYGHHCSTLIAYAEQDAETKHLANYHKQRLFTEPGRFYGTSIYAYGEMSVDTGVDLAERAHINGLGTYRILLDKPVQLIRGNETRELAFPFYTNDIVYISVLFDEITEKSMKQQAQPVLRFGFEHEQDNGVNVDVHSHRVVNKKIIINNKHFNNNISYITTNIPRDKWMFAGYVIAYDKIREEPTEQGEIDIFRERLRPKGMSNVMPKGIAGALPDTDEDDRKRLRNGEPGRPPVDPVSHLILIIATVAGIVAVSAIIAAMVAWAWKRRSEGKGVGGGAGH